jgi:hypothetical protein
LDALKARVACRGQHQITLRFVAPVVQDFEGKLAHESLFPLISLFVEDFNYGPGNPRMSNRVADHPATGPTYSASNWMYCEHQLGGVLGNTDAALLANIVVTKSVGLLQYRVFMEIAAYTI